MTNVWLLHGPSRFLGSVLESVVGGSSVLIVCPSPADPEGAASAIADGVVDGPHEVLHIDINGTDDRDQACLDRLFVELQLSREPGEPASVETLARHPELGRRLVLIDARGVDAFEAGPWIELISDYSKTVKERPSWDRASFVLMVDGKVGSLVPLSDVPLRVVWWWGSIRRPDLDVFLEDEVGDSRGQVFKAVVAEVSGPDLQLASVVANEWEGDLRQLEHLVDEYCRVLPRSKKVIDPDTPCDGSR